MFKDFGGAGTEKNMNISLPAVSSLLCWCVGLKSHLIVCIHTKLEQSGSPKTHPWPTSLILTVIMHVEITITLEHRTDHHVWFHWYTGLDVAETMWYVTYGRTIMCLLFLFCKNIHVASDVKRTWTFHHHMKETTFLALCTGRKWLCRLSDATSTMVIQHRNVENEHPFASMQAAGPADGCTQAIVVMFI